MKKITAGILAHVDAGKTTMAEALLYKSGTIKNLGRVDHKDAFLDTQSLERQRGITIFSKQAIFNAGNTEVTLLDTPGHVDFSAEMERTLSVLDYAILVISGSEGVQAHTATLWSLLEKYRVPVFIWVNKMDLARASKEELLDLLKGKLSPGCIEFGGDTNFSCKEAFCEEVSLTDEGALDEFLETGSLKDSTLSALIAARRVFPCYFGSALKVEGIEGFLEGLDKYTVEKKYPESFSGRVFKITRDEQGNRLSWIKITGGSLGVREELEGEKITQLRFYSGRKFTAAERAPAGSVVAACGPAKTFAGQGLGGDAGARVPLLEPVLSYSIKPLDGTDPHTALTKLSQLAEEDPMLRIIWNSKLREIQAQLMGDVQIEVLKQIIEDRFGMKVSIDTGSIMYKETIDEAVLGLGHFEPLRHYAEVHLLMEPLPRGTGLIFESACSTDDLDLNWQRLILTNLQEKEHLGVLTGSPITDMKITLVAGRAHLKHTEGGDFRQATYRAVRQGLMRAKNVLLEPWYDFRLEVPADCLGRAISDIKAMHARFSGPEDAMDALLLTGTAPVSEMQDYQRELLSYTKGKGRLACSFAGYYPCHNTAKVIEETGYEAERDGENIADSVFCSHGAGVNVKWDCVQEFMHLDSGIRLSHGVIEEASSPKIRSRNLDFDEKELEAIMLKEFGPIKRPQYSSISWGERKSEKARSREIKKDYLIVDGYNIIYSWEDLKKEASGSFAGARSKLCDMLENYKGYKGGELVLVFDGYKVKDNPGSKDSGSGIKIVYTKEGESADGYIERLCREIGKNYNVRVATSDGMIQLTALRAGVIRMSARELEMEVRAVLSEITDLLQKQNSGPKKLGELVDLSKLHIKEQ